MFGLHVLRMHPASTALVLWETSPVRSTAFTCRSTPCVHTPRNPRKDARRTYGHNHHSVVVSLDLPQGARWPSGTVHPTHGEVVGEAAMSHKVSTKPTESNRPRRRHQRRRISRDVNRLERDVRGFGASVRRRFVLDRDVRRARRRCHGDPLTARGHRARRDVVTRRVVPDHAGMASYKKRGVPVTSST